MIHARTWKRILNQGIDEDHCIQTRLDSESLAMKIIRSHTIVANWTPKIVADATTLTPDLNGLLDGFTNIPPPLPEFWIDWRSDTSMTANRMGMTAEECYKAVEAFGRNHADLLSEYGVEELPYTEAGAFVRCTKHDDDQWNMTCEEVIAYPTKRPRRGLWTSIDIMGGSPKIDSLRFGETFLEAHVHADDYIRLRMGIRDFAIMEMYQIFSLLTLLSCKNVAQAENKHEPKQERRAIKRFGEVVGGYRYHTLIVYPSSSMKHEGDPIDIDVMPFHLCRGHFSEYGPEFGKGLLFGKYSGRFYIPPHMKGSKKNGIVDKDYEMPSA